MEPLPEDPWESDGVDPWARALAQPSASVPSGPADCPLLPLLSPVSPALSVPVGPGATDLGKVVEDPVHLLALQIAGFLIRAQELISSALPFVCPFLLGFSLSLSLAGMLSPSAFEPIIQHGRILDEVFNATVLSFLQEYSPCADRVHQTLWYDWLFSPSLPPDCEPIAFCMPAFQRLMPVLAPSVLAATYHASAPAMSVRFWFEASWHSSLEYGMTQASSLRTYAITFISDHALVILVLYMCFPGRTLLSLVKLITKSSRPRNA